MSSTVSVEDLAREIGRHHDSPHVRTLLEDLRGRQIDLREFCSRVRQLLGADVLVRTVKGLQDAQKKKLEAAREGAANGAGSSGTAMAAPLPSTTAPTDPAPAGAAAPEERAVPDSGTELPGSSAGALAHLPAPTEASSEAATAVAKTEAPAPPAAPPALGSASSSADASGANASSSSASKAKADNANLGTKVLIHALLCPKPQCAVDGCSMMKAVLTRVETHTKACSISNLPGGQNDCTTCNKWQSMIKLREHYRRKLITYIQKTYPNDASQAQKQVAAAGTAPPPQQVHQQRPQHKQQQQTQQQRSAPASSASGSHAGHDGLANPANLAAQFANHKPAAAAGVGKPVAGKSSALPRGIGKPVTMPQPITQQPSLSSIGPMTSFNPLMGAGFGGDMDFGGDPDEMDDLDNLLASELDKRDNRLVPGQAAGGAPKRSRPMPLPINDPGWGGGGDDNDEGLSGFAGGDDEGFGHFGPVPVGGGYTGGMGKPMPKMQRTERGAAPPPQRHGVGGKPPPPTTKPAAAAKPKGKAPSSSRSGRALRATARKEESDEQTFAGSSDAMSDVSSTDDVDLAGFEHIAKEGKMMSLIEHGAALPITYEPTDRNEDRVAIGMHVIIDTTRQAGGPKPTMYEPLETKLPPHRTNAAEVRAVHADGTCDVQFVCSCNSGCDVSARRSKPNPHSCQACHAGGAVARVAAAQRQICCSTCLQVNLPMELPQLRCSGCDKQIKSGQTYYRDLGLRLNIRVCHTCFDDLKEGVQPEYLKDVELRADTLEKQHWNPKDDQDYDNYCQCEGGCERWFHYVCASFPDPAQLPAEWKIDKQKYICKDCQRRGVSLEGATRLLALQYRRASSLRSHPLSDAIEGYIAQTMKARGVTVNGLVVRVVSSKRFSYPAFRSMKARYGTDYPDDFPYDSRALLAFQEVEGRDVCFFAMYVQEYGPTCPAPNTNRAYISYLDSVRYLKTEPPNQRTPVYHAIINGYLRNARDRGFDYAHIWVAPPQAGDEYVFHTRPADPRHGTRPMSMGKLREWYEHMLTEAVNDKVVSTYEDIQTHVEHLTSIREFPLFEGDFFPDHLKAMLEPQPVPARAAPPGLVRESSHVLVEQMKKQTKSVRKRFLIATLNQTERRLMPPPGAPARASARGGGGSSSTAVDEAADVEISHSLVDKRMDFLQLCKDRHWQFNELRRAHFSTMMLLASLGGEPQSETISNPFGGGPSGTDTA